MRTITAYTTATTITTTTKCKCENKFKPFPTLSLAVSEEIKLEISACIQMKALVASFLMVHDIWLFDKRKMVKIAIRMCLFFVGKNQQWPITTLLSLPPPWPPELSEIYLDLHTMWKYEKLDAQRQDMVSNILALFIYKLVNVFIEEILSGSRAMA